MPRHDAATYDDANLILKLYDLRREDELRKARAWFISSFRADSIQEVLEKYPQQSDESRYIRMVVTYWEMVASFLVSGVISHELFFQSGREMLFVWERIRQLTPSARDMFKDPTLYRNLETAAEAFVAYLHQQSPELYPAFAARVAGTPR